MSTLADLESYLKDIYEEYTPQFLNKEYWIQMQFKRQETEERILVQIRIFRQNTDYAALKSAMFCYEQSHVDFLRAYLAGALLMLGKK